MTGAAKAKFAHPLGLSLWEWQAIENCHRARSIVPNGHFLAPFGRISAYAKMAERGFLTEIPAGETGLSTISDPRMWRVFKFSDENFAAYNAALAAAGKGNAPP